MTNGTDITRTKTYQYDSSNGLLSRKTLPGGVTIRVTQGTDTIVPMSGAIGGALGGAIAGGGNALLCGGDVANGIGQGALYGALSGILFGGINGGVKYQKIEECFVKGCNALEIEENSPLDATDAMLKKAQEIWYPDAPMDHVRKFTVENVPDGYLKK